MATWAEISTWTNQEIASRIEAMLPSDCSFRYRMDPEGSFSAEIVDNEHEIPQWQDRQADERLLLLNAYGWLFTRKPTVRNQAWVRGSVSLPIAKQALPETNPSEDPEDLSPEEIAAVYGVSESK